MISIIILLLLLVAYTFGIVAHLISMALRGKTFLLIQDSSNSMSKGHRLANCRDMSERFVSHLRPEDHCGLCHFNTEIDAVCNIDPCTPEHVRALTSGLRDQVNLGRGTGLPLSAVLGSGVRLLGYCESGGTGKYLVVFCDGAGHKLRFQDLREELTKSKSECGIVVVVVGVEMPNDCEEQIEDLCRSEGHLFFSANTDEQREKVVNELQNLINDPAGER